MLVVLGSMFYLVRFEFVVLGNVLWVALLRACLVFF